MHRLLILRHAKTERSNPGGDHARRLVERGRSDAARMGEYLLAEGLAPTTAWVSDATRARETFEIVARELAQPVRIQFERSLYLAAPDTLMDIISQTHDEVETLLLVGHNPGLHELAYAFGAQDNYKGSDKGAGAGSDKAHMDALSRKFPTCSLAVIEFEMQSWRDLGHASSRLQRYITAKSLRRLSDEENAHWSEGDAD